MIWFVHRRDISSRSARREEFGFAVDSCLGVAQSRFARVFGDEPFPPSSRSAGREEESGFIITGRRDDQFFSGKPARGLQRHELPLRSSGYEISLGIQPDVQKRRANASALPL